MKQHVRNRLATCGRWVNLMALRSCSELGSPDLDASTSMISTPATHVSRTIQAYQDLVPSALARLVDTPVLRLDDRLRVWHVDSCALLYPVSDAMQHSPAKK